MRLQPHSKGERVRTFGLHFILKPSFGKVQLKEGRQLLPIEQEKSQSRAIPTSISRRQAEDQHERHDTRGAARDLAFCCVSTIVLSSFLRILTTTTTTQQTYIIIYMGNLCIGSTEADAEDIEFWTRAQEKQREMIQVPYLCRFRASFYLSQLNALSFTGQERHR